MTVEGVDYSSDHPDPHGLYAVGKRFAGRYLGPGSGPKLLTPAEAIALRDAGLSIVALVEGGEQDALSGFPTGKLHAEMALRHATQVRMPDGHPFYAAVDFDVQAAQWDRVLDYFAGFASVLGGQRVGLYGGYQAMVWAARDQAARWLYQTYAWSGGRWYVGRNVEQYRNTVSLVGGTVDLDRGITPYFGQWMTGGAPVTQPIPSAADNAKAVWATKISSVGANIPVTPASDIMKGIVVDTRLLTDTTFGLKAIHDAVTAESAEPDLTALLQRLDTLAQELHDLAETPMIDAVAVAKAIAADRSIVDAIASGVAANLARIQGEITLTGTLAGGIVAPPS